MKSMFLSYFVCFAFVSHTFVVSQIKPSDRVISKIVCQHDTSQAYALFLPSGYDSSRKYPILYCFKPEKDALYPVAYYADIMERHGVIMVCSWNSQNGPWQVCIDALHAVWKDTHHRFSIDPGRVYATGFLGGARTASELAIRYPHQVTGVIGIGSGFSTLQAIPQAVPFRYFYGLYGNRDYNKSEMVYLDEELSKRQMMHRIVEFEGIHQWAPFNDFSGGFEWMMLNEMRDGKRTPDSAWIVQLFDKRHEQLKTSLLQKKFVNAARMASAIYDDFHFTVPCSAFVALADSVQKLKAYSDEMALRSDLQQREVHTQNIMDDFLFNLENPLFEPERDMQLQMLYKLTKEWQPLYNTKNEIKSNAAYRCLDYIARLCRARGNGYLNQRVLPKAVACFDLARTVWPDDAASHYNLACALALSGKTNKALDALETAVKVGFNDVPLLDTDPDLNSVRSDKKFNSIRKKAEHSTTSKK